MPHIAPAAGTPCASLHCFRRNGQLRNGQRWATGQSPGWPFHELSSELSTWQEEVLPCSVLETSAGRGQCNHLQRPTPAPLRSSRIRFNTTGLQKLQNDFFERQHLPFYGNSPLGTNPSLIHWLILTFTYPANKIFIENHWGQWDLRWVLKGMDKKKDCSSTHNSADENRDSKWKYKSPNDDPLHRADAEIKEPQCSPRGSSRNTQEEVRRT